jgi:hypothetical protein
MEYTPKTAPLNPIRALIEINASVAGATVLRSFIWGLAR